MKYKYTWLLIAVLLTFLAPSATIASEEGEEFTSSVEVGAAGMSVDDEVNKVNEYSTIRDDDGVNPYLKARIEAHNEDINLDLDAKAMSNRDQSYDLEADYKRVIRVDGSYDTFKHWLSHDQLDYMRATMKNQAQTFSPSSANPAVYSEDLVPGTDFYIIHRKLEMEGEVAIPDLPNVVLKTGFREEQREGTEQAIGISHCTACHVEGSAKSVDETTTDLTLGATGKFGMLTVDYEYLTRDFDDDSKELSREYLEQGKPFPGGFPTFPTSGGPKSFNGRLNYAGDSYSYDTTPDSEKDSHTLKARYDLSNDTVFSSTYVNSEVESDKSNDVDNLYLSKGHISTDYDSYSMRASTRLGNWKLSGYGRKEEIDSSNNTLTFVNAAGADVPASIERTTYESEEARDITTLGLNAYYRFNRNTSMRLGYEYEDIDRDIDVAQDTETNTVKASVRFRPNNTINTRVSYKYQNIDDQFMHEHGNMGPEDSTYVWDPTAPAADKIWYGTDYYTQRLAEATNLPEDVHEVKLSATWAPSSRYSVTVYNRYRFEENDLNMSTYEKTSFSPGVTAWWAPSNDLNLTMAYNFNKQETENQMCVGWYHG
jgi:hypothetical protein